jgi:ketosteroid isomerase-like protein
MPEAMLRAMFDKDLAQMRAGDIDGMLVHYHPDAQIMRLPDVVARGRTEVREFLADYVALKPEIVEIIAIDESADTVLYHSKININGNILGIVGTWVLRDGLIWRQTAVLVPA